jgi:16S rRNA (uracil1498-N3)-methyltransferase
VATRFYVAPEQITADRFVLLGSEARHAAVVLRKKAGDTIDLFDGKDLSYQGRIQSVSPERVEGVILSEKKALHAQTIELNLCQALIKGPRWDWLIEKACEVGVTKIIPLITTRTVVKPTRQAVADRWQRIALAASKQCGRPDVMKVGTSQLFLEALKDLPKGGLALIPWEKETGKTIRQAVGRTSIASLFIGPEGGWETAEVELARRHGVVPVRLGPTLLRSETAGLVASALVLAELGVYS